MNWTYGEHQGIGWRIAGQGTPIVILRGLGRWSEHWCGFDDLLAESFKVIAIDNRGFGMSKNAHVGLDLSIDQLADDVVSVLSFLSLKSAVVAGVSLGGMLAISLAARYPHLVERLVLVNSSVGGSPYRRITSEALLALGSGVLSRKNLYEKLASVLLAKDSTDEIRERLRSRWSEIDERHGLKAGCVFLQLLAAARFRPGPLMSAVVAPTLVIKGTNDQFIDPRNSDWICQHIRTARLVESRGGHELGLDQPTWLADTIKAFC